MFSVCLKHLQIVFFWFEIDALILTYYSYNRITIISDYSNNN